MKSLIKNDKAFHPVISGIMVIAIVGITIGILIMTYSSISDSVTPATYDSYGESINDSSAIATVGEAQTLTKTIGSIDGVTPYSMVVTNSSKTFVLGTDYNVSISGNSINVSGAQSGKMDKNLSYGVTYDYVGDGSTTLAKIDANVYKGFDLGSIAPIVLAAGLIITIVIGFAGLVMGGGRD